MTLDQIKAIALASGFTERQQADGSMDLNGYVYAFADAMYAEGQRVMQTRAGEVANKTAERILAANTHRGRTSSAGSFASGVAEDIGCDIRALEVKP